MKFMSSPTRLAFGFLLGVINYDVVLSTAQPCPANGGRATQGRRQEHVMRKIVYEMVHFLRSGNCWSPFLERLCVVLESQQQQKPRAAAVAKSSSSKSSNNTNFRIPSMRF